MAFDENLAERLRLLFRGKYRVTEKKMFGGLAFMVNGHMCCGIVATDLVVRTGPDAFEDALERPNTRPMDFTGRPMKGFVYVVPAGYRSDRDLKSWAQSGLDFVLSQPPK
ncbi:MAG: TfoX/Sxy family protein [Candidatus Sulfotelmatobacter sp.]